MHSVTFVMACSHEPPTQVFWAAARVLHHNPGARLVLVVDGADAEPFMAAEALGNVVVTRIPVGPCKLVKFGGMWFHKMLCCALEHGGDFTHLVKLDPDTATLQGVGTPPDGQYAGLLVPRRLPGNAPALTHCAVMFQRVLVNKLVTDKMALDPVFCDKRTAINPWSDVVSEEIIMGLLAAKLRLRPTPWNAVDVGCFMSARPVSNSMVFAHPVLPFEAPRAKNFTPAPWFQNWLAAERTWFTSKYPELVRK